MKIFIFVLILSVSAHATDFYQPGLQVRCLAMGGTCMSHARGASALFYNPAALSRVDGFNFTIADMGAGISKDTIDFSSQLTGGAFTQADVNNLFGKTIVADITARSGFAVPNFGFGVYSNNYTQMKFNDPAFPTFNMNFISDYGYVVGGSISLGGSTAMGISLRHVKRWGGTEDIDVATLVGATQDTLTNGNFLNKGIGHAVDIGFITNLNHPWNPVLSLVWMDAGATTYNLTSGVKDPPRQEDNMILGLSLSQQWGIFDFTHAIEYKFIRQGGEFFKKVHLGTETAMGLFDLRAGINQGYITYGAGVDVWLFQVDATVYATELGTYGGQARSDRYSLSLTFEMDFDQSFKMRDKYGKKRRLKQRR